MNIIDQYRTVWKACIIAFFAITLSIISPVYAQTTDSSQSNSQNTKVTEILCNAVGQLTGPVGRSIAILIIISLAISLFLGKVSWGMAIAVAVGMGILFGAKDVVKILSGDTGC